MCVLKQHPLTGACRAEGSALLQLHQAKREAWQRASGCGVLIFAAACGCLSNASLHHSEAEESGRTGLL